MRESQPTPLSSLSICTSPSSPSFSSSSSSPLSLSLSSSPRRRRLLMTTSRSASESSSGRKTDVYVFKKSIIIFKGKRPTKLIIGLRIVITRGAIPVLVIPPFGLAALARALGDQTLQIVLRTVRVLCELIKIIWF